MTRQHAVPIYLPAGGLSATELVPLALTAGADAVSEAAIQKLIFAHPSCLPIREIDPLFCNPVPLCVELNTPAGPIDILMITPSGLPVLVECKLWRNPEGRREVVGQILDYAKELSRWSSSDLQREVSRRLKSEGNTLLERVREAGHAVDEMEFNDALTLNLRRGRFLLLIVGNGIREGVEAITEYLQLHAGLHFTLGLVELPIYSHPNGDRIVVPRILARTKVIEREVVAVPDGYQIQSSTEEARREDPNDPATEQRIQLLKDVLRELKLADPEQPEPKITPKGHLFLYMPAPKSTCWINVSIRTAEVGIYVSASKGSVGDKAVQMLAADWAELRVLLGGNAELRPWHNDRDRFWIAEFKSMNGLEDERNREEAIVWLRERINTWVSVLRPRIRAAVADLDDAES